MGDDGVGGLAHGAACLGEHLLDLVVPHKPGVVGGLHLVKIEVGDLVGVMHDDKRKRHGIVERFARIIARLRQLVGSRRGLLVGRVKRLAVVALKHHRHQIMGALGKLGCGYVADARLLDANVHDVGGVGGKGKVAQRLHGEQDDDDRHGELVLRKVL